MNVLLQLGGTAVSSARENRCLGDSVLICSLSERPELSSNPSSGVFVQPEAFVKELKAGQQKVNERAVLMSRTKRNSEKQQ